MRSDSKNIMTKVCKRCGREKDVEEFKSPVFGLVRDWCKACFKHRWVDKEKEKFIYNAY